MNLPPFALEELYAALVTQLMDQEIALLKEIIIAILNVFMRDVGIMKYEDIKASYNLFIHKMDGYVNFLWPQFLKIIFRNEKYSSFFNNTEMNLVFEKVCKTQSNQFASFDYNTKLKVNFIIL